MKRNLLKTMLVAVGLVAGMSGAWAETGDVTTNVDIDFSKEIDENNVVSGNVGQMIIEQNSSYPTSISESGILVLGTGTHTVTLNETEYAGTRDVVTISFDLAFGKLRNKNVGFSLVGSNDEIIGEFSFCPYSSTLSVNTFGIALDDMYYGYNTVLWDRKVSFTIELDYLNKKITTSTKCYKRGTEYAATEASHVVDMVNANPLKTFKVTSSYDNTGRFCQFDNLLIKTKEGDYSVESYVDVVLKYMSGETELGSCTVATNIAEGEEITYGYPKYILQEDGSLYEASRGNPYYVKTTTASSTPVTINYTKSETSGAAYFKDFGETVNTDVSSTSYLRASGGATVSAPSLELIPAGTLADGKYTFEIGNYKNRNALVKVGEHEIGTLANGGNSGVYVITKFENVIVCGGVAVTAVKNTSSQTDEIDYILAIKTGEATTSVSVTDYATYCPAYPVEFAENGAIEAYKALVDEANSVVNLTRTYQVAAGEGVLVHAKDGGAATEVVNIIAPIEKDANNAFVGTLEGLTVDDSNYGTVYFLGNGSNGLGFYKAKNGGTLAAGKAYLSLPAASEAKSFRIAFGGDTTGINEVVATAKADGAYYTLSGVRVENPTKGLYIQNGKKVVIK